MKKFFNLQKEKKEVFFIYSILIFFILFYILKFMSHLNNPLFTPDSWFYFNISQTIFKKFNNINVFINSYQFLDPIKGKLYNNLSTYNISFPILYPFFLACINKVFNMKMYAGFFLNFIIGLFNLYINILICKINCTKKKYHIIFGLLLTFLFLAHSAYLRELLAGKSTPLQILLIQIILYI